MPSTRGTTINRTTTRASALGIALALLVTACSGSDDSSAAPDGAGGTTTTTTATPGGSDPDGDDGSPADGAAVASPGCTSGAATTEVVNERHEMAGFDDEDGTARWYLLTAPEGDDPVPLVLDFHGLSEGAEIHTQMSGLGTDGLEHGFATAFPHGTGNPVRWQVMRDDSPDLPFIDAVLDEIFAARCIDTSRVYATGLSNGAMLSSYLACHRADRFAAIAPVAGLSSFTGCDPARPVPILAFHGTADPILLFNGGIGDFDFLSGEAPAQELPPPDLDGEGYPRAAREWADLLGCDPTARDEERGEEIVVRTWSCPDGVEMEFVIIVGGGHSWPGSEFSQQVESVIGPTTFAIDANDAMWELFQRHQLPG